MQDEYTQSIWKRDRDVEFSVAILNVIVAIVVWGLLVYLIIYG